MKYGKESDEIRGRGGFTLIELVVVIVILGILAAALPRFTNLSSDARIAALKGVEAAMRTANEMLHAKAVIQGQVKSDGTRTYITINGQTYYLKYGYTSDVGYLLRLLDLSDDFMPCLRETGSYRAICHKGAKNPDRCFVQNEASYNAPPTYTLETSGC
jgi:MSHA pilin protein MshA